MLRAADKLTASLAIVCVGWMVLQAIGSRPRKTRQLAHILTILPVQIVAVAMASMAHPTDTVPVVVAIITVAMSFVAFYLFFRTEPPGKLRPLKVRLDMPWIAGGIMLSTIAVVMFGLQDRSSILHSTWHLFVGLGLSALQEGTYRNAGQMY